MSDKNLSISVIAMPSDTNSNGDIFGGWLLSQMDLAGLVECRKNNISRCVTIAIDKMKFVRPVNVGDLVQIYTSVSKVGNTSITILTEAWATNIMKNEKVTEGLFTFVQINDNQMPIPINKD